MNSSFTGIKPLTRLAGFIICLNFLCQVVFAQTPVSSFTSNVTIGCAPLNVFFTNTSGQANSYLWNFGNGNSSTLLNPSAVYAFPGNYTVTLVATNTISGLSNTSSQVITVVADPIAGFTATPQSSCAGSTVISFNNTSSNASLYTWDFGDGSSSNSTNPTHLYTTAGTYTVKLIANNAFGCSDIYIATNYITIKASPTAAFTANLTSTCNVNTVFNFNCTTPGVSTYLWNFGDGNTSSLSNPNHTYGAPGSYTITLTVTDAFGCSDTLVSPNYINIGPSLVPSFTVNSQNGCVPFNCVFTCGIPNGTSWLWDFGDGNTSTLQNPSHVYTNPGNYSITLTMTTASGCNGTNTVINFISVDAMPTAGFTTTSDTGCTPFNAQFNNTSTGAVSWLWDFGDGTTSVLQNPSHLYNTTGSFNVTLHAYSANGCEAVINSTNAVVTKKAYAFFNASNNIGCPPLTTTFNSSASTSNIVAWNWTFGDGGTSTLPNPAHIYNTLGTYSVKLVVTTDLGCTDSLNRYNYIRVVSGITNYTVPDTIKLCQPGVINCVDPTFGSNVWSWNFGDGGTSNIKNPSHTYINPGTYTITLTNNMPGGCSQTFNPYAIVQVMPVTLAPIQTIAMNPCSPYAISLANATPNVTTYTWNFGDGTTSTQQNPTHVYTNPGTYTITLTLLMESGCITAMTKTVTFGHPNPTTVSGTQFCLNDPVVFSITNPAAFTSCLWDFGDGNSSSVMNPAHIYADTGTYTVNVTTTDTSGCIDTYTLPSLIQVSNPLPSFTITGPSIGCSNLSVQFNNTSANASTYLWDFGDGSTSTAANPSHMYNSPGVYTVSLTASANGCTKTTVHTNQVIINAAQCNFMYTFTNGCLPITVNYTDLSPNAVSWAWDFGDGNTSTLKNPTHTFTTPPTSNVTLTIVDGFGCTKTRTKPNISYLQANFKAADTLVCTKYNVTFTDLSGSAVSWLWDFGDGQNSVLQNPIHAYSMPGVYTVSLIATFPQGCTDTVVLTDYITVSSPRADFTSPTVAGCSPTQINFNNLSLNASSYLWSFGDTTTSAIESPSHIYSIPGYYTINLVAIDNYGCTDTIEKVNYIKIPGTYAQFNISGTSGCELFSASFHDLSINANSWSWNFGDGNISNLQNPTHIYNDSGNFTVTLITQDTLGCNSFFTFPTPVVIYPNPVALATCADTSGCEPHQSVFTNSSTGASSYLWIFGDGDTSSLQNPVHIYSTSGQYFPYLIAIAPSGCRDTFYLTQGITVNKNPTSIISSNAVAGCSPSTFTLNNQSLHINNPVYNWQSGNGITSSQSATTFSYNSPGNYNISLVVTNITGCRDSSGITITIYDTPVANAVTNDLQGCNPFNAIFNNQSTSANGYLWNFGDGNTDTSTNPLHTYLVSGTYNVSLIAYNNRGCTDTFNFPLPIVVDESPVVNFTADHLAGCFGTPFGLVNQSTGTVAGTTYTWKVGGNVFSFQQNPSLTPASTGLFSISLEADNHNGCKDSLIKDPYLLVYDTVPPPVNPLKSVSVTSDSTVQITWSVSAVPDFACYVLLQLNTALNKFIPIYVDSNQNNGGISITSDYTNTGLNTLDNVYTYLLETYDMCGNTEDAGKLTPHSTINVTAVPAGKDIQVSWSPYSGCQPDAYEISRQELPSGSWQMIASVVPNIQSYLDTGLTCPVNYAYRITATNLCGEGFISHSDTSAAAPENDLADQEVQIVRSTVIDNKSILTEWVPPVLAPERVMLYNIYRSTDSISYSFLAAVPSQSQSYLDFDVDVNEQNYFYKILAVNDCSLESTQFTNSSSILLKGSWDNQRTNLQWTKYRQWDNGVNQYVIEKLDKNGQWIVVKVVDGTINAASLDE